MARNLDFMLSGKGSPLKGFERDSNIVFKKVILAAMRRMDDRTIKVKENLKISWKLMFLVS